MEVFCLRVDPWRAVVNQRKKYCRGNNIIIIIFGHMNFKGLLLSPMNLVFLCGTTLVFMSSSSPQPVISTFLKEDNCSHR